MPSYTAVNFIRERLRVQETQLIADRRLFGITFVLFIAFLVATGVFIGYRLTLRQQLAQLDSAIATEKGKKTALRPVQELFWRRQTILNRISSIIEKRGKNWEAIDYLYAILPSKTSIQSINLSAGKGGSLEFAVRAPDIFTFRELSTLLQSEQVLDSGYRAELGSLSRSNRGEYTINVRLFLTSAAAASSAAQPVAL